MKIAVFSDSHGDTDELRWLAEEIVKEHGPINGFIHCGDGIHDFEHIQNYLIKINGPAEFWEVAGNCDFAPHLPDWKIVELEGIRVFLTHGHRFHVKSDLSEIDQFAVDKDCSLILYGHTHVANWEMRSCLLVNPGTAKKGRAALITINAGHFDAQLLEY